MPKPDTAEIERLAAQAPSVVDVARKQHDEQAQRVAAAQDRAGRMFAIEQATKACTASKYETHDIIALARGFHAFLTETK